jgi:hypothetical protein
LNTGFANADEKFERIAELFGSTALLAYELPPVARFVVNQSLAVYTWQPSTTYGDEPEAIGVAVGATVGAAVGAGVADTGAGVALVVEPPAGSIRSRAA